MLICFSRFYVGLNYVSDIAGVAIIGGFVALSVAGLYRNESWYAQRIIRLL